MTVSDGSRSGRNAGPRVLPDLFDRARLTGLGVDLAHPAVSDATYTLSHGEYIDEIGRTAALLVSMGVEPGDRVALHLHKGVGSFVAVHAVLRAGAVMVPLDPLAPPAAAQAVLRDAEAAAVITDVAPGRLPTLLEGTGVTRALVEGRARSTLDDDVAIEGVALVDRRDADGMAPLATADVGPDDPAYIIYTSGSTGEPKGIVHTHRSALAYARLAVDTYGLEHQDVLVNIASLHFDQSTFELYAAPAAGASVVVVPDAVLRFPASVSELVAAHGATVWYSVPYVLRQLERRGALESHDLSSLRWVLFGGESYPPGELAALMRRLPHARWSNVYGPAEVNQCTFHHLDEPPAGERPIPIGRAWADTDLEVVDEQLRPVEPGEPGELLVRSPTMMQGYWRRPELDAERILVRDGERWYRTGDVVSSTRDGELVFLGRRDHQVKVRGQRIELEAVEQAVLDLPGVRDCGVLAVPGDDGALQLVAAVVADELDERQARRTLAARLPAAAVPTELQTVASVPRNSNGKVDRSALAAQLDIGDGGQARAAAPTGETR